MPYLPLPNAKNVTVKPPRSRQRYSDVFHVARARRPEPVDRLQLRGVCPMPMIALSCVVVSHRLRDTDGRRRVGCPCPYRRSLLIIRSPQPGLGTTTTTLPQYRSFPDMFDRPKYQSPRVLRAEGKGVPIKYWVIPRSCTTHSRSFLRFEFFLTCSPAPTLSHVLSFQDHSLFPHFFCNSGSCHARSRASHG
jgi:hypothetical protein